MVRPSTTPNPPGMPSSAACASRSQLAALTICHTPANCGFPSTVRAICGRGDWATPTCLPWSQVPIVGSLGPVLRQIALDDDLNSCRQRVLREPATEQRVRWPTFDHPIGHLAVWSLDVYVDPGVRVDPFHLGHRPFQGNRLVSLEFGR